MITPLTEADPRRELTETIQGGCKEQMIGNMHATFQSRGEVDLLRPA